MAENKSYFVLVNARNKQAGVQTKGNAIFTLPALNANSIAFIKESYCLSASKAQGIEYSVDECIIEFIVEIKK